MVVDPTLQHHVYQAFPGVHQNGVERCVMLPVGPRVEVGHLDLVQAQLADKGAQCKPVSLVGSSFRCGFLFRRCTSHLPVAPTLGIGLQQQIGRIEYKPRIQYTLEQRRKPYLTLHQSRREHVRA